ncbi:hypothetical protein CA603_31790 [Paraburkholderia hospita]|nr:hypothetical protein CA603_31790 [Paraburkholderia hospita]
MSPHWPRHPFVSHVVANGMCLESARNFAVHDSLDTTSTYATAELARQYREAESFLRNATYRDLTPSLKGQMTRGSAPSYPSCSNSVHRFIWA